MGNFAESAGIKQPTESTWYESEMPNHRQDPLKAGQPQPRYTKLKHRIKTENRAPLRGASTQKKEDVAEN